MSKRNLVLSVWILALLAACSTDGGSAQPSLADAGNSEPANSDADVSDAGLDVPDAGAGAADAGEDYDFGDEYTRHDRIVLDGNDELHAAAAAEGWPGDGSPESPYVISGYEIDLQGGEGGAVDVRNIDLHFIVRRCYLHGGIHSLGEAYGYGVLAWNVQNMRVEHTVATDNFEGVRLEKGSRNCVIHYNDLSNNAGHGVALASAHTNVIEYNRMTNEEDDGMLFGSFDLEDDFDAADNNIVRYNEFSGNSVSGVCIFRGSGNQFYGNAFGAGNLIPVINAGGENQWDNDDEKIGNWWVDFDGTDEDDDGLFDEERLIPGGAVDRYPLVDRPRTTP